MNQPEVRPATPISWGDASASADQPAWQGPPARRSGSATPEPRHAAYVESPAPAYDPRWTVRPHASVDAAWPSGSAARSDGPDCRPGEARSLQDRRSCRALAMAPAEPSAPMVRSGDEDRTAAFAKEAAVKKRWRDYREGDGAYPGLRSLFGMN